MSIASRFPASICHVSLENVSMLTLFGQLLAAAVVISLLTGKTYYRRVIPRSEELFNYWFSRAVYLYSLSLCLACFRLAPISNWL
jgi:hypothetical protein